MREKEKDKSRGVIPSTVVLIGVLAIGLASVPKARCQTPQADSAVAPKTADQVYKNIKVLKGVPANQVIPAMQFITAALGVGCNHCHVEGHFDQDDKKPKDVARKMMTMMFAINKDNFEGHREVTCNSCHNGSLKPASIPILGEEAPKPMPPPGAAAAAPEKPDLSKLPPASDVVEKYIQAIGGAAAVEKVSSRVAKGTTTGQAGRRFPIEIFSQAPGKRAVIAHYPNGDSVTVYDGHGGWAAFPHRPARDMEDPELDAAKIDADIHLPIDLKAIFTELKVAAPQKIGDHDAYQILGVRGGLPPVEFYFDEQSGLLLRQVRYAESPLGLYPTRIDYADYRDQDGVKIPFAWTTYRPGNSSAVQLDQVQQNVAIDDAKFARPPASPKP